MPAVLGDTAEAADEAAAAAEEPAEAPASAAALLDEEAACQAPGASQQCALAGYRPMQTSACARGCWSCQAGPLWVRARTERAPMRRKLLMEEWGSQVSCWRGAWHSQRLEQGTDTVVAADAPDVPESGASRSPADSPGCTPCPVSP